jgi:hypothetical protein
MAADWDRVVELARVSSANPVAAAVLRLHHEEYGSCAECAGENPQPWPCRTVQAIEEAVKAAATAELDFQMAIAQAQAEFWGRWADAELKDAKPKEPTDG